MLILHRTGKCFHKLSAQENYVLYQLYWQPKVYCNRLTVLMQQLITLLNIPQPTKCL